MDLRTVIKLVAAFILFAQMPGVALAGPMGAALDELGMNEQVQNADDTALGPGGDPVTTIPFSV